MLSVSLLLIDDVTSTELKVSSNFHVHGITGLEGKRIWKRSFRAESSSESEEKETVKGREVKKTNLRDIRESEQSEEGDGSG